VLNPLNIDDRNELHFSLGNHQKQQVKLFSLFSGDNNARILVLSGLNDCIVHASVLTINRELKTKWATLEVKGNKQETYYPSPQVAYIVPVGMDQFFFLMRNSCAVLDANTGIFSTLEEDEKDIQWRSLLTQGTNYYMAYCPHSVVNTSDDFISNCAMLVTDISCYEIKLDCLQNMYLAASLRRDLENVLNVYVLRNDVQEDEERPIFTDCIIRSVKGDEIAEFKANYCIIQHRAPKIAMLLHEGVIQLENISNFHAKILLRYIYTDVLSSLPETSTETLRDIANKYGVTELIDLLEDHRHSGDGFAVSFANMIDNETTDFRIEFDGTTIGVHKFIICVCSEFFQNTISLTEDDEEESSTLCLDNILETATAKSLRIAIEWMYTRQFDATLLDNNTLFELYCIANFFSLSFLKRVIELHLITLLDTENVLEFVPFAETHSAQALLSSCHFLIVKHFVTLYGSKKEEMSRVIDREVLTRMKKDSGHLHDIYLIDKFNFHKEGASTTNSVEESLQTTGKFPSELTLTRNAVYDASHNTYVLANASHSQGGAITFETSLNASGFETTFTFQATDFSIHTLGQEFSLDFIISVSPPCDNLQRMSTSFLYRGTVHSKSVQNTGSATVKGYYMNGLHPVYYVPFMRHQDSRKKFVDVCNESYNKPITITIHHMEDPAVEQHSYVYDAISTECKTSKVSDCKSNKSVLRLRQQDKVFVSLLANNGETYCKYQILDWKFRHLQRQDYNESLFINTTSANIVFAKQVPKDLFGEDWRK
jgi:hypothetical protein